MKCNWKFLRNRLIWNSGGLKIIVGRYYSIVKIKASLCSSRLSHVAIEIFVYSSDNPFLGKKCMCNLLISIDGVVAAYGIICYLKYARTGRHIHSTLKHI